MKTSKKILSLSLALAVVFASFVFVVPASAWETRTNEADLRLGILNDTHITSSGSGDALNVAALTALKALGMEKLAFVGDNVYYTKATDTPLTDRKGYQKLWAGLEKAGWSKEDVIAYAMGNHEFPQGSGSDAITSANAITAFEEEYGPRNQHTTYNGFHMIAGGPETYNNVHSRAMEKYYIEEIDKALCEDSTNETEERTTVYDNETADDTSDDTLAVVYEGGVPDSEKPVFLFLHQPMAGTLANQTGSHYSAEFKAFLAARPQVVFITAHKHLLAQHPQIIGQDAGFTAFQSPMTAGGYQSQWGCKEPFEITDQMCSQGSFLEVKDNVVYLYRIDYKNGAYIGEPFVVDIPAIVADRLDDDETNDTASMLYTNEKRAAVTSAAAYPEGATVTVDKTDGNSVTFTYPMNAYMETYDEIQQDNFIRAYKIEMVNKKSGVVAASVQYQAEFWKAEADRAETATQTLSGLTYGTEYILNVYPMTPFGSYGAPISVEFTTEAEEVPDSSIRYEFEDYYPYAKLIKASDNASGGKLVCSNQAGDLQPYGCLGRNEVENPHTFSFDVVMPADDTYEIIYAAGCHKDNTYVSYVTIDVDGEVVGTNDKSFVEDLSAGGGFPWSYIPMSKYRKTGISLSKGKHTVTVTIPLPTATAQAQPYLFALDYIQFTPETMIVSPGTAARAELEKYIGDVTIPQTDGTTDKPKVELSDNASGGAYAFFDTKDGIGPEAVQFEVPINVTAAADYTMKYVIVDGVSPLNIYLDSMDSEPINVNLSSRTLDSKGSDGKYPVFSSTWAAAREHTTTVSLPEGKHTLIFDIAKRSNQGDIALYLDYIELKSNLERISGNSSTRVEFENYAEEFAPVKMEVFDSSTTEGVTYAYIDTSVTDKDEVLTLPVYVEEAGTYKISYVMSNVHTVFEISLNGTVLNTEDKITAKTLDAFNNELQKYTYFGERWHNAVRYSFEAELPKGFSDLTFTAKVRPEPNNDVAGCFDYVEFVPVNREVKPEGETVFEIENYIDNFGRVPNVGINAGASAGKYVYSGGFGMDPVTFTLPVEVAKGGVYNGEFCFGFASHLSEINMYLDSVDSEPILTLNNRENGEVAPDFPKQATSISHNATFFTRDYPAGVIDFSIDLSEGAHTLIFVIDNRSPWGGNNNTQGAMAMDYVKLAPQGETVTLSGGVATANLSYDTPVTGTVVLALYNGGALVAIGTTEVNGATTVTVSAPVSGAVTSAKAFAWSSVGALKPVCADKILTVK
ncbi:MAG: hypothetical protein IJC78_01900 [Clostridia bacterium]|nr:hypothetical protein [Clostridia bacterium]